jgi:hypothetical protein
MLDVGVSKRTARRVWVQAGLWRKKGGCCVQEEQGTPLDLMICILL